MGSDVTISPHARFRGVPVADVRWTGGFWKERFEVCRTAMIPNMWRLLSADEPSHAYANFRIAAGLREGEHRGPRFNDGDLYKWFEAAAAVLAATDDAQLEGLLEEVAGVIARAQREDGYIHTPVIIASRRDPSSAEEFADRLDFEMYNFGHLMTAACRHYEATAKRTLLTVAEKACSFLERYFSRPSPELAKNSICPSYFMGLLDMYRTTGQERHLELARRLFDLRSLMKEGSDDNQDRVPFREQRRATGHAVRANYLYAGAADLFAETGDETLMAALQSVWENVALQKLYITGGCGALYDGVSPDGGEDHWAIQRVHQAYGREYQLPNITAYNESCANVGNLLWNWRMLRVLGEARFADVMELALYNSILSAISLDGVRFFYQNALRREETLPFPLRWSRKREPYISSFCCPPNVVRTIAQAGAYAYGVAENALWVHLYGANELEHTLEDGSRWQVSQTTDYPWDGRVRLRVEAAPDGPCRIMLRVPAWADGATVRQGSDRLEARPGTYTALQRRWQAGDTVELDLPMRPRLMEAHPLVEETRGQVAVMRGPVVYCLESVDLPEDVKPREVWLPEDVRFEPARAGAELGNATVLEGVGEVFPGRGWDARLYREVDRRPPSRVPIRLIPYFGWDNRGPSQMTVWMPLRRRAPEKR
jgi:DUF1680 family protein